MCSGLIDNLGVIAGRMACILAVALLACASSAHSQVIEEGGFPVKGGDNSGEPFSLSCPSRLVVQAGSSIVLSCSATAVPEEGIRYEWESISVGGLDFLSAPDGLSPLFMAPLSGEGVEYVYRLTAMSVGVYETATVTVVVEGFPEDDTRGEGSGSAGVCDTFAFEGYREGCFSKGEGSELFSPFGGFPGEEGGLGFPFPGSPGAPEEGLPGLLEAGDPAQQTAPYLDCPPAVFLEELEIGSIECHVSDALGEEFLEYMWEPVGSTTRDYLDNPRLIPEDAPNPSVVAPEAPVYETLESFHSGETTFRYRYRLTATSRATGLSSSSEVEVFVSSSRPSVYCPLEIVVEEGETAQLDCEGVDPLSARMDYDEEGASILWEWEGLWGTSMAPLAATDLSSPLFTAPVGSAGKQYHYIASMTSSSSGVPRMARRRVTVTVTGAEEGAQDAVEASAPLDLTCPDHSLFVGDPDIQIGCTGLEGEDIDWTWTSPHSGHLNDVDNLDKTHMRFATFEVPESLPEDVEFRKFKYAIIAEYGESQLLSKGLEVLVLNMADFGCTFKYDVDEGDDDIMLNCWFVDGPMDAVYDTYAWAPRSDTPNTDLLIAGTDGLTPTFSVPDEVDEDETYRYTMIASAEGFHPATGAVTVIVKNKPDITVTCEDSPYDVDEGANDIPLECEADGAPTGSTYTWSWSPTTALTGHDTGTPTFDVPDDVDKDTIYTYTVTASAANAEDGTAEVTVTVRDTDSAAPVVTCNDSEVYEATADFTLDCSVTNEPSGATYAWTGTDIDNRLTGTEGLTPTFDVLGTVNANTDYEYTVTLSASGIDDVTEDVTITVKNKPDITVTCEDSPYEVDEGDTDIALECDASGGPAGSTYTWSWSPTTNLTNHNTATPTFSAPDDVDRDTTYTYTVTATADNAEDGAAEVTVTVKNTDLVELAVTCSDPDPVYEATAAITLYCRASGAPAGSTYNYAWTARGATAGTDLLSATNIASPVFEVPADIPGGDDDDYKEIYEYTLTVSASGAQDAAANVSIKVKEKPNIRAICVGNITYEYFAGTQGQWPVDPQCDWEGAPGRNPTYHFKWTTRDGRIDIYSPFIHTPEAALGLLASTIIEAPIFYVPNVVAEKQTYLYSVTVSAKNADDVRTQVNVVVRPRNRDDPVSLTIYCRGATRTSLTSFRYDAYDTGPDVLLDCEATGAPEDSTEYTYSWTGNASDRARLSARNIAAPTFEVVEISDAMETYNYTLSASAPEAQTATASVSVRVRKENLALNCSKTEYEVFEGDDHFSLDDCEPTGIFNLSDVEYEWTARGSTSDTSLLEGDDTLDPTFFVPVDVPATTDYKYTLTASAPELTDVSRNITVKVKQRELTVTCGDQRLYARYQGTEDFTLDCSASGAAKGASYAYKWTPRDDTPDTSLLSSDAVRDPTFFVPDDVPATTNYEYVLTASSPGATDGTVNVRVRVLDASIRLSCTKRYVKYEKDNRFMLDDCTESGAPPGSAYNYAWTPRGDTPDTDLLTRPDEEQPYFELPNVSIREDTDYEYTLTVSARGADPATADVMVRVKNRGLLLRVDCEPDYSVDAGDDDFSFACTASGSEGAAYKYEWTPRIGTSNTALLSATDILSPTFKVPEEVSATHIYRYTLTVSVPVSDQEAKPVTANVLVLVNKKRPLNVTCASVDPVYEGEDDFDLECVASGAPFGSTYSYEWSARGGTPNTGKLSSTTIAKPTFAVPEEVARNETYRYTLTVTAGSAAPGKEEVTVRVLNKRALALVCTEMHEVFEGSEDFSFDCSASGAPAGSSYSYSWTARGNTSDTDLLISGTDGPSPTFDVPEEVDAKETYEYLLTVSAENAEDATAEVTVTVLNRGALNVVCASPPLVYEGSEDFPLDCSASGTLGDAPVYAWTPRGSTPNTALLVAGTDGPTPTFAVPDNVNADTDYEYLLTVTAENGGGASAEVTVRVLNERALAAACASPPLVYEGEEDFALDCTASGAPSGSDYAYEWTARGTTADTALLIAGADGPTPTFAVPGEVDGTTTYEYLLTASAEHAEAATAEVTVTVLDRDALVLVCTENHEVYEGSGDFAFDCSVSGVSSDTDLAYSWTAVGNASDTDLLTDVNSLTPTFGVPEDVAGTTTYEYRLTVSAENAESARAEVTVTVLNSGALSVTCADPGSVYEGSVDITFDCSASGASVGSDYNYAWTARGSTSDTALLITGTDGPAPTFAVPHEVNETTTYEYLLTVSAENAEDGAAEVTVTVLNSGALSVTCADPGSVYEGSVDITFDCSASGASVGSDYNYAWTARGSTSDTALLIAGTDGPTPTFAVPDEVDETTTYEYLLTVSAENAEDGTAEVTVTVLNSGALSVTCADPGSVYEGSVDITFDCSASGASVGSDYNYAWTARGSTSDTALLIAGTDGPTPTFAVPDEVDETTTYEYLLTVSAENAEDGTAEVTVTVLNRDALAVVCTDPDSVYEGSEDIMFDCTASGAPDSDPQYTYVWTARGDTQDTSLLSAVGIASPTFLVPDEVDATTTYEYLLTVSAENAEDGTAEVTVTVLNRDALAVVCTDPDSVYEGSEDLALDCSASGASVGSDYNYAWTARGSTSDTALLIAGTDGPTPTFAVPDEVDETTTYEYLLTVSAENAEDGTAEVTVTVLNSGALSVTCADPGSVYEGAANLTFDCSASGAPAGSDYNYAWTARGSTSDTALLIAGTDGPTPTFAVPDEVDETTTYEYLLTVSAENAEDGTAEVTVTVLNKGSLALACADPGSVYEGWVDITFDCSASGASVGSDYNYAWTARGSTSDTALLIAGTDGPTPTFAVPDEVDETTTYEYLLTVSAENAEDGTAEVTVTVLNKGSLALACADPGSVYEGSVDITFDCSASGASVGSDYNYAWTARGDTQDTSLLSAVGIASPVFLVPDEVAAMTTYEYLLTASAANAEDATAEVAVTVLDRAVSPPSDPVSPPLASSSAREPSTPSALGVTVSASPLRFGVQSADTEVSLDPMTDRISTHISGPYHAGRMTLSPGGGEALDENGEMDLSIELASPVMLRRKGGVEDALIVLSPQWSFAESCEQLSSQAIGGLYTEVTLSEDACRLLYFGGELDLTGVPSGRYAGSMDIILRSGENEETHSVEVHVTVIPAQRVITIGPGGVRFSTSRELPAGLTEEQNLSIYPDVAFMTEEKPHGMFELSNPSLVPLEVTVSARFGYTEATENGREVVVEEASESHLGDLSQVVDIYPGVLVLMPGEKGLVRYGIEAGALTAMAERGYAAFFDVVSEPRQYVRSDQMPEEVAGDRTARVTMRVPGVYVPGEAASQLRATLMSISYVGSMSATFLVETEDHPFVGEVVAYDGEDRELGRRETLVYTRSRVRIPLDRIPEGGAVFLRFSPRGSDRVPLPVSVPWDAPRRDIGGIGDKEKTPTSASIAGKP